MKITKKDVQIISHLRKNSREMLTKLSKKTGVPVSTIFDRLKLHTGSLITKNTSLIDFQMLGFNSKAKVILQVDKESREELKEFLLNNKYINSAYRINNGYDFMFEVIARNMKELENFIENLEDKFNIIEKNIFYIIYTIKQEDFLSKENAPEIAFAKPKKY
jgi:DNA-binding Lrp family transcriptional regulator